MIQLLPDGFPETEGVSLNKHSQWQTPALKVGIVNLMPLKRRTEADLLTMLDSADTAVDIDFISMATHRQRPEFAHHVQQFYRPSDTIADTHYDRLIVTGAPVEMMPFENVDYWNELTGLIDFASENIESTMYVCWGAFAALYHRYGIDKRLLPRKLSGVFMHRLCDPSAAIVKGFDPCFRAPHSRNTEIDREAFDRIDQLKVIAESDRAGAHLIEGRGGREFYVMGHWEYAADTLDMEFRRDTDKGLSPLIPENYYNDDNPDAGYVAGWQIHGRRFFNNWLK